MGRGDAPAIGHAAPRPLADVGLVVATARAAAAHRVGLDRLLERQGGHVRFALAEPDSATVRITVIDDGIGIPADKRDKVFEPFRASVRPADTTWLLAAAVAFAQRGGAQVDDEPIAVHVVDGDREVADRVVAMHRERLQVEPAAHQRQPDIRRCDAVRREVRI